MALRKIRIQGDSVLTKVCRPVEKMTPRIKTLIEDMLDTMYDADGVGLAACCAGWWLSMWERDRLSWSIPRLSSPTAARPARKDA